MLQSSHLLFLLLIFQQHSLKRIDNAFKNTLRDVHHKQSKYLNNHHNQNTSLEHYQNKHLKHEVQHMHTKTHSNQETNFSILRDQYSGIHGDEVNYLNQYDHTKKMNKSNLEYINPSIPFVQHEAAHYLNKIFRKYSLRKRIMPFEAFKNLLHGLGLGSIKKLEAATLHKEESREHGHVDDVINTSHRRGENHHHSSESHETNVTKHSRSTRGRVRREVSHKSVNHHLHVNSSNGGVLHNHSDHVHTHDKCLKPSEILSTYHISSSAGISESDFLYVCPAILYQLDRHACASHPTVTKLDKTHSQGKLTLKVWGFALLSVSVISLVGLAAVAVVPLMQLVFYNYLIQCLVAMAVGSLTGDAFLHLLPHSLVQGDHDHDSIAESASVTLPPAILKGCALLAGMYFFFLFENVISRYNKYRQKRNKWKTERVNSDSNIGRRLAQHNAQTSIKTRAVRHSRASRRWSMDLMEEMWEMQCTEPGTSNQGEKLLDPVTETTVTDRESSEKSGHSHGAGTDKLPNSVASIAWMVIMGDGIHNLSDGMAIGAAFAGGITGGLSTSLAVFCHELPHELGDFAVLLRSGMSIKQALAYNVVSSALSFLGLIIGLLIGNIENAGSWIYVLTAGMFVYIALVDMLPELSQNSSEESGVCMFLVQNVGLLSGVAIMLLIALYEKQIRINLDS